MNKKLKIDHIIIQITYFMTTALTYAFGTYTMLARGVSSSTIGILIAIGNFIAIIIEAIISNILDNSNKINSVQMNLALTIVLLVSCVINYSLNVSNIVLYINYTLYLAFVSALMPLHNQLSANFVNAGYQINYGIARAFGSLAYAITCFAYGFISEKYNYQSVTISLVLFQILAIIILMITNKHFSIKTTSQEKMVNIPLKEFLHRHKLFILTCLGSALLMTGYNATESFMLPIVESVGGNNLDSSIIQGLKAIFEVPVIFYFAKIEKKIKLKTIFLISGISFVIKALAVYFATSTLPIYISQALQTTAFAFLLPATVSYINNIMSQKELARGHSLQSMVQTLLGMIYTPISGNIIDNSGIKSFALITTLISIVGALILTLSIKEKSSE